jgi:HEPN domain-containing protein
VGEFKRDPDHWLLRLSPDEWIRAALGELARAERAWAQRGDARSGATGAKRAAGMALNGALIVEPDAQWGRTYVEHLEALAVDGRVPDAVRTACRRVLDSGAPLESQLVSLRTPRSHEPVVEAARDVIAHAWAVVKKHETTRD